MESSMRQLLAILVVALILPATAAAQKSCEALSSLKLEKTTITSAEVVAAGMFTPAVGHEDFPGGRLQTGPGVLPGPRRPSSVERLGH